MHKTPFISVLMPSLNVVNYIEQCIQSVVDQTLKNIEIICIDAGSTDGTLEILERFAAEDKRITVIRSDKKSYGYQMNLGLDAAKGEYIGIVETDDWIEPNTFEVMWDKAQSSKADVIKSNHFRYTTKPRELNVTVDNLFRVKTDRIFCPSDEAAVFTVIPTIWSAIYRKSMLEQNTIRFHETPGASYQDASFQFMVFAMAGSMYCIKDCFYHYRTDNEASSMNSRGKVYCIRDEMEHFYEYLKERPEKFEKLLPVFYEEKHRHYSSNYRRVAFEFKKEFLMHMYEEFKPLEGGGLLKKELFDPPLWRELEQLLCDHNKFYRDTCKQRLGREEFSSTSEYIGYMVRYVFMFVPKKINHVIRCLSEHGWAYTWDQVLRKMRVR